MQLALGLLIAELTAIHLQEMTRCRQRLTDAGKAGRVNVLGEWQRGQTMRMGSILAGLVEFALQVLLGDLHIPHGHADVFVAEQLHQRREADSEPEHLGRI